MMQFVGKAERISSDRLARLIVDHGYKGPEFLALLAVESRGPFDEAGRPAMLFEPHLFYRHLNGQDEKIEKAVRIGVAYRKWGERPYPRSSYARLQKALDIDEDAALMSASWGRGQILGDHAEALGYDSPWGMVSAFMDSEEEQILAIMRFLRKNGLDDKLRECDWHAVARGWNGPGYLRHGYHKRLEKEYENLVAREKAGGRPTLRMGDKGVDVQALQHDLKAVGYPLGRIDGTFGRHTRGAVLKFQADHGLTVDGVVGPNTWAALRKAGPAPEREIDEHDLREAGSRTIARADGIKASAVIGGGAMSIEAVLSAGERVADGAERGAGVLGRLSDLVVAYWPALLVLCIAGLVWWGAHEVVRARVRDARKGYNLGR